MKRFLFPSLLEELCETSCCGGAGGGVTVSEDEQKVYIDAAIPGASSTDTQLTLDQELGLLKISATVKNKRENVRYHCKATQRYCYEVPLNTQNLDLSKSIEATYKDGILSVELLKSSKPQPLKIDVKIA